MFVYDTWAMRVRYILICLLLHQITGHVSVNLNDS